MPATYLRLLILCCSLIYHTMIFFFFPFMWPSSWFIYCKLLSGELFVFLAATFTCFCVLLEALVWSNFTFFSCSHCVFYNGYYVDSHLLFVVNEQNFGSLNSGITSLMNFAIFNPFHTIHLVCCLHTCDKGLHIFALLMSFSEFTH